MVTGTPRGFRGCSVVCLAGVGLGANRAACRVRLAIRRPIGAGSVIVATRRCSAVAAVTVAFTVVVQTLWCRGVCTVV